PQLRPSLQLAKNSRPSSHTDWAERANSGIDEGLFERGEDWDEQPATERGSERAGGGGAIVEFVRLIIVAIRRAGGLEVLQGGRREPAGSGGARCERDHGRSHHGPGQAGVPWGDAPADSGRVGGASVRGRLVELWTPGPWPEGARRPGRLEKGPLRGPHPGPR